MNSSNTHVSTVKRIMSAILPKFGIERKIQYDLSLIAKRIRKNYSNLYSPLSGKIEPFFLESVQKLMTNLEYFRPTLETTVGLEDNYQLEQFQRKLVDKILHSKKTSLKMLRFDSIKEYTYKKKGQGHSDRMQALFQIRYNALKSVNVKKIHHSYQIVLQLWLLSSFNFKGLLSNLQKKKINGSMHFISYPGDLILEDLKDLYFLTKDFKLDKAGLAMMEFFFNMQKDGLIIKQEFLSHYSGIQQFLDSDVPSNDLADIIKSSSLDPNITLKKQELSVDFYNKIKSKVFISFENSFRAHEKEVSEQAYRSLVDQLFQDYPIFTMEMYSSQVNKILILNNLPELTYVTALRLIKTFTLHFYDKSIYELFTYFLDKADFISSQYKDKLLVYQISCNELSKNIAKFESDLTDPKLSKLIPIMKQCTDETLKSELRKQYEKTIKGINKLAANIIESGTSGYDNIMQAGIQSLKDINSKTPVVIDNCRYMRDNEEEFLLKMENATGKLVQFIQLMEHFSINKEKARKWKDKVTKGEIKNG